MRSLPLSARLLVCAVIAFAAGLFPLALPFRLEQPLLFVAILAAASIMSLVKVTLPLPHSALTMSLSSTIVFVSLILLGTAPTMVVAAVSAWSQCTFRNKEPNPAHRTLFSIASLAVSAYGAGAVYTALGGTTGWLELWSGASPLVAAVTTYFLVNTVLVATAVGLSTQACVGTTWDRELLWSAPGYFVGGAVAAGGILLFQTSSPWLLLLVLPPLSLTYRSYKTWIGRLEEGRLCVKEAAELHLATIEALALAIDAKDQTSQSHIHRMQFYSTALARALDMSESHIQGVKTAALMHDIGKLAIPEHILSKPGPLTPEEFHKIRAHPKIGADIISAVPFPYPVAPLILSHHERWDGKGYPSGLKGDEIPLGARILAVVDCFDALICDRPYHQAMSPEAARTLLQQEAGRALDPLVVATFIELLPSLQGEAASLEQMPRRPPAELPAPRPSLPPEPKKNVFDDIARAHREIYALYEIAQAMGTSLGLADTMALISGKLSNLVPYSCAALFLYDEETESMRCRYATGVDAEVIQLVTVRSGEGLTGWVARNRRTLVNARPGADLEAAGLAHETTLQSALVCPLIFNDRFIGTLAVYHTDAAFYRDDHRRLLDRVSEQTAAVISNAMVFEQTQEDALTDLLTGLPNTRFLFMHLTRELARAARLKSEVTLMVMDLDNFKDINDTYGHHVGDRALGEIARVLRAAIRPYDICVRYAGDEFIVVLSGCGEEEAERKRQELQRTVHDVVFEAWPGKPVALGISVGAAVCPQDGESYEALLAAADNRMYRDKAGRKRRGVPEPVAGIAPTPEGPELTDTETQIAAAN